MQSVPITSNVLSSNPAHYVIKFVTDLRQVCGFLLVTPVSSTNKTDHHNITEILLKVVLNTITLILTHNIFNLLDTEQNHSLVLIK
jgi:hypothetical protein